MPNSMIFRVIFRLRFFIDFPGKGSGPGFSLCQSGLRPSPPMRVERPRRIYFSGFWTFWKIGVSRIWLKNGVFRRGIRIFWHFLGGQKIISKLTFLRYLRDFGAFLAISDASDTHFLTLFA